MSRMKRRATTVLLVCAVSAALVVGAGRLLAASPPWRRNVREHRGVHQRPLAGAKELRRSITTNNSSTGHHGHAQRPRCPQLLPSARYYKELQVDHARHLRRPGDRNHGTQQRPDGRVPIEDTPAYRAGVKAGDQIIKIEDEFTKDMPLVEAVKKMRGPAGTTIHVTLRREGRPALIDLALTREVIKIQSGQVRLLDKGYGYIRLTQFQERTDDDLQRALTQLDKDNGGPLSASSSTCAITGRAAHPGREGRGRVHRCRARRLHGRPARQSAAEVLCPQGGSHIDFPMIVLVNGAAPAHRKSSPARCKTTSAPCCSAPRPSARARSDHPAADDSAAVRLTTPLLHAQRPLDPGDRHHARHLRGQRSGRSHRQRAPKTHPLREHNLPRHLPQPTTSRRRNQTVRPRRTRRTRRPTSARGSSARTRNSTAP